MFYVKSFCIKNSKEMLYIYPREYGYSVIKAEILLKENNVHYTLEKGIGNYYITIDPQYEDQLKELGFKYRS